MTPAGQTSFQPDGVDWRHVSHQEGILRSWLSCPQHVTGITGLWDAQWKTKGSGNLGWVVQKTAASKPPPNSNRHNMALKLFALCRPDGPNRTQQIYGRQGRFPRVDVRQHFCITSVLQLVAKCPSSSKPRRRTFVGHHWIVGAFRFVAY